MDYSIAAQIVRKYNVSPAMHPAGAQSIAMNDEARGALSKVTLMLGGRGHCRRAWSRIRRR